MVTVKIGGGKSVKIWGKSARHNHVEHETRHAYNRKPHKIGLTNIIGIQWMGRCRYTKINIKCHYCLLTIVRERERERERERGGEI